jgi:plasmid maintenance system antidote protein VapI
VPKYPFKLDWNVPPSEFLWDELNERGMEDLDLMAVLKTKNIEYVRNVLYGTQRIDPWFALQLEDAWGVSAEFWLKAQMQTDLFEARKARDDS